jgi:hypothetical protein
MPLIVAEPASGVVRVVSTLTVVVLPAPFGPRSACTVPSGTTRSSPARAWTGPDFVRYVLVSPEASMMAMALLDRLQHIR